RPFVVHLPVRAPAGHYPLVVALHGGFGTPAEFERTSGLDAIADREGFAVLYPGGENHHWNDGRDNQYMRPVDDVGVVRDLIEQMITKYPIDPDRVYVTGHSNGGDMAYRLGCELSDKLAAIAPVAGEIPSNIAGSCHPARPVSVIAIHGTADRLNPFAG